MDRCQRISRQHQFLRCWTSSQLPLSFVTIVPSPPSWDPILVDHFDLTFVCPGPWWPRVVFLVYCGFVVVDDSQWPYLGFPALLLCSNPVGAPQSPLSCPLVSTSG